MILGRIWRWLAAALAAALPVVYLLGRRDSAKDEKANDNEEYIDTRKKIDAVDPVPDADKWLSERIKRRDL